MAKTVKVAILGGGMAGVAAAWTLAHATGDVKYEITLYDADWRLGGKCASGHDVDRGMRIDEHGIHILLGFYSQVLRILRDGYAELDPTLGFRTFPDVLEPGDQLQLPDKISGSWTFWTIDFPPNDLRPGDADPDHRDFLGALLRGVHALFGMITAYEAKAASARPIAARLWAAVPAPAGHDETLLRLAGVAVVLEELLAHPPTLEELEVDTRHLWMGIWFGATNLLGILKGQLFTPQDFQTPELNAKDYKAWLKETGGECPSPELTWDSPIVNAVYDLVFSRAVGFAAGAALYDVLLMLLLYNGHVFYRMAGTGDVIFGPLYFALKARGVRFRFEHTVTDVKLGPPGPDGQQRVAEIDITGDDTERTVSEIFVKVGAQWSWPMASLVNRPTHAIKLGPADFDYVISALPLGALPSSAPSLMGLPVFAKATDGIVTTATQGLQLWFDAPLEQLGWSSGRMMLGSFDRPFNSCADMAQAMQFESLPGEKAVMYMSDVYDGQRIDPVAAALSVRQQSISWIQQSLPTLLPQFSWPHLLDPDNGLGSNRIGAQYWRANITGTELYVASKPGTIALRPAADGSGVQNLLLASDWVFTEENQGCVEGASRSGVKAAQALDALARAESDQAAYVQKDGDWVFPGPVELQRREGARLPLPRRRRRARRDVRALLDRRRDGAPLARRDPAGARLRMRERRHPLARSVLPGLGRARRARGRRVRAGRRREGRQELRRAVVPVPVRRQRRDAQRGARDLRPAQGARDLPRLAVRRRRAAAAHRDGPGPSAAGPAGDERPHPHGVPALRGAHPRPREPRGAPRAPLGRADRREQHRAPGGAQAVPLDSRTARPPATRRSSAAKSSRTWPTRRSRPACGSSRSPSASSPTLRRRSASPAARRRSCRSRRASTSR